MRNLTLKDHVKYKVRYYISWMHVLNYQCRKKERNLIHQDRYNLTAAKASRLITLVSSLLALQQQTTNPSLPSPKVNPARHCNYHFHHFIIGVIQKPFLTKQALLLIHFASAQTEVTSLI